MVDFFKNVVQIAFDIYNSFDGWSNIFSFFCIVSSIGAAIGVFVIYLYIKFLPKTNIDLKYYVPAKFQYTDPCLELDFNNIDSSVQIDLMKYFKKEFKQNKKGKLFLILADSGMGKTVFLHKLFLKYKRHFFWRKRIHLIPLTNERDINDIKEIKDKSEKILLLDALDEDSYAIKNRESRINELVVNTQDFYKVIITCRTQFFPDSKSEPENTNLISYGTQSKKYKFTKLYISPFSDETVRKYLKKKFRFSKSKRKCAEKIVKENADLMARPMLLGVINKLLKNEHYENICDIYSYLIKQWIEEKEFIDAEILYEFVHNTARYLFLNNKLTLSEEEIKTICEDNMRQKLEPSFARSRSLLNRDKFEYKFAHKSIYEYLISKDAFDNPYLRVSLLKKIKNKEITDVFYKELCTNYLKDNLGKLYNLDLSYMIIADLDLRDANFKGAFLKKSVFKGVKLEGANFQDANLKGTNFKGAFLINANFKGAFLINTNFKGANLKDAIFQDANIRNVNFQGANLDGVNQDEIKELESLYFKKGLNRKLAEIEYSYI